MSEKSSRTLFAVEMLLLALPALLMLGFYAILLGGWTLYGLAAAVILPFTGMISITAENLRDGLLVVAMLVGILLVAASGAVALWTFANVAHVFWWKGSAALQAIRSTFNRGLAFAVLPLCVMLPFGLLAAGTEHAVDVIAGFYVSGLALIIPVFHLWLEVRYRLSAP